MNSGSWWNPPFLQVPGCYCCYLNTSVTKETKIPALGELTLARADSQQTNIKISVLINCVRWGNVLGEGAERESEVGVGPAAGLKSESERRSRWEVKIRARFGRGEGGG